MEAIPVHILVLSTLRFLATGTFKHETEDRSGISQPSLQLDHVIRVGCCHFPEPKVHSVPLAK